MASILVVGPPRSGTTWIAQALASAAGTRYVHEPDGDNDAFALRAKRGRPRHVPLTGDDDAPDYEQLWRAALAGGVPSRRPPARLARYLFETSTTDARREVRRGGRPGARLKTVLRLAKPLDAPHAPPLLVVAKSVNACLAVEWIAARLGPRVLIVDRQPLNVLASWDELGIGLDPVEYEHLRAYAATTLAVELPPADASRIERQAGFLGVLTAAQRAAANRHPDWVRVEHEAVIEDPLAQFERLCTALDAPFDDATAAFLDAANRPGTGYDTKRIAADLRERWRQRLTESQAADALAVLARFH
jgi:hypothetical protein